jgi:hypothetical protein
MNYPNEGSQTRFWSCVAQITLPRDHPLSHNHLFFHEFSRSAFFCSGKPRKWSAAGTLPVSRAWHLQADVVSAPRGRIAGPRSRPRGFLDDGEGAAGARWRVTVRSANRLFRIEVLARGHHRVPGEGLVDRACDRALGSRLGIAPWVGSPWVGSAPGREDSASLFSRHGSPRWSE